MRKTTPQHNRITSKRGRDDEAPLFELLEPRILYSADAFGVGMVALPDHTPLDPADYVSVSASASASASASESLDPVYDSPQRASHTDSENTSLELVFIDSRVPDAAQFIEAWSAEHVRFIIVDEQSDAINTMTDTVLQTGLKGTEITSVKIVSHGASGVLALGADEVTEETLRRQATSLQSWAAVLSEGADLQLFGCDLGQGAAGQSFVDTLATLTGADVAASEDLTGADAAGANWILEITHGSVAPLSEAEMRALQSWEHTLAVIDVSYTSDDIDFDEATITIADLSNFADVSLRMAVEAASNTVGDDVIRLTNDSSPYLIDDSRIRVNAGDGASLSIVNGAASDIEIALDPNDTRGGLFALGFGVLNIDGDPDRIGTSITFSDANAVLSGGAIRAFAGTTLNIENAHFENNATTGSNELSGAAIYTEGVLNIDQSRFENNRSNSGSAISATDTATLSISNSVFENNRSGFVFTPTTAGGAVFSLANTEIKDTQFIDNSVYIGHGGAVYADSGLLSISGSTFTGNTAVEGGAIYALDLQLSQSVFSENSATSDGGAVHTHQSARVTDSHFENNIAFGVGFDIGVGGAIFSRGDTDISSSSFNENWAERGSAIAVADAPAGASTTTSMTSLSRLTFNENEAGVMATVYHTADREMTISFSTFAENTASTVAAAIVDFGSNSTTVSSSVFYQNIVLDGSGRDLLRVKSGGFNLFDTADDATPVLDIVDGSLSLGPMTGVGDSPVFYRPLLNGSSAINAGSALHPEATDISGEALDELPDIGAHEYQGATGTIYWADSAGKIWRSNSDFSNAILIVDTGAMASSSGTAHEISGLQADLNGVDQDGDGRLYWVNENSGELWYSSLDGSLEPSVVLSVDDSATGAGTSVTRPNSLALDALRDLVFVAHGAVAGSPAAIRAWDVSGASAQFLGAIAVPGLENPRDLHFSAATGRLYWIDELTTGYASIHSVLPDGTGYSLIHAAGNSQDEFEAVVVDDTGEHLYFTNASSGEIHQLDLANGDVTLSAPLTPDSPAAQPVDMAYEPAHNQLVISRPASNAIALYDLDLSTVTADYVHNHEPVVIASASTSDPAHPSFEVNDIEYLQSDTAVVIDGSHLVIDQPGLSSGASLEFVLTHVSELNGVLKADGVVLNENDTFTLNQVITYENARFSGLGTDVLRFQLTDGVSTSPVQAMYVALDRLDSPMELNVPWIYANENSITVLDAAQFVTTDANGDLPHSYVADVAAATQGTRLDGMELLVDGIAASTFTHAQLQAGLVAVSTENVALSNTTSAISPAAIIPIQPFSTNSDPLDASSPVVPGVPSTMTVVVAPIDDPAELSANPLIILPENQQLEFNAAAALVFTDEESGATPLLYDVTVLPEPTLALLSVNGVPMSAPGSFSHADLVAGNVQLDASGSMVHSTIETTFVVLHAVTDPANPDTHSNAVTVQIDLPAVDDAPVASFVAPANAAFDENTRFVFDLSHFDYVDEENHPLAFFELVALTDSASGLAVGDISLSRDGEPMTAGDFFTLQDIAEGLISVDASAANLANSMFVNASLVAHSENSVQVSDVFSVELGVNAVNDAPQLALLSSQASLFEGQSLNIPSGNFVYTDEENDDMSHLVIDFTDAGGGAVFTLDGVPLIDGQSIDREDLLAKVLLLDAVNADVNAGDTAALGVHAVSVNGLISNAETFSVTLIPVDDAALLGAPAGSITVVEGTVHTLGPDDFTFTDEENATLEHYVAESLPDVPGVSLELSGVTLSAGDTFSQADLDLGRVTINAVDAVLLSDVAQALGVSATVADGSKTNTVQLALDLVAVDDPPILARGTPISAFENALTVLTHSAIEISDEEGLDESYFTIEQSIPESLGTMMIAGQLAAVGDTFTLEQLVSGQIAVDLRALDIDRDTTSEITLSATSGEASSSQATSEPATFIVDITAINDAPRWSSALSLSELTQDSPLALEADAVVDPEGDDMTISVWQQDPVTGEAQALPAWLAFDPTTSEFVMTGTPDNTELTLVISATDSHGASTSTLVTLPVAAVEPQPEPAQEPQAAAAMPLDNFLLSEPALAVIASSVSGTDESAVLSGNVPAEKTEATLPPLESAASFSQASVFHMVDFESKRIDLSQLLQTSENAEISVVSDTKERDVTNAERDALPGLSTNDVSATLFRLDAFESNTYEQNLKNLAERWDREESVVEDPLLNINTSVGSSVGLSSGFTVGYILWLLRGGALMGSVLSSLPAWRLVDPLPILAELDDEQDNEGETLESMVNQQNTENETELTARD